MIWVDSFRLGIDSSFGRGRDRDKTKIIVFLLPCDRCMVGTGNGGYLLCVQA